MWSQFALGIPLCAIFLYLPGYLVCRALHIGRFVSFASAPLITIGIYTTLGIINDAFGAFSYWDSIFFPSLAFALVCDFVSWRMGRRRRHKGLLPLDRLSFGFPERLGSHNPWGVLALSICIAAVITGVYFVSTLGDPSSFTDTYDNAMHQNLIRSLMDSGRWTMFDTVLYVDTSHAATPTGGYYPACWHMLAAMVAGVVESGSCLGANVLNTTLLALVLPTTTLLFASKALEGSPRAIIFTSMLTLCCAVFPWGLLNWGTLYPVFLGFTLMPIGMFYFMALFREQQSRREFVLAAIMFLFSAATLFFCHPNAIFSAVVLLAPYSVYRLATRTPRRPMEPAALKRHRAMLVGAFLLLVAILWTACFIAPPLQAIIHAQWDFYYSYGQAVLWALSLGFDDMPPLIAFMPLVVLGIVRTFRDRRYLWITISFVLLAFFFILAAGTDNPLKLFLVGIWYNDMHRIGATAAFAMLLLTGLGFQSIVEFCERHAAGRDNALVAKLAPALIALVLAVVNFLPSFTLPGTNVRVDPPMGHVHWTLANENTYTNSLDADERAFLKQIKWVTGDDLVINMPFDGSAFAYPATELNTYFRTYGLGRTPEAEAIRLDLVNYTSHPATEKAIRTVQAKYVVKLDQAGYPNPTMAWFKYDSNDWTGINAIDDTTPGFEIVYAQGDKRLYRITATADVPEEE